MNDLNRAILEVLERDARSTAKEIAIMLGCEEAEVKKAIAQMEKDEILLKYTTVVNTEKNGFEETGRVKALIEVRIMPQRDAGYDAVARRIARFDEVKTMYLMSGAYDLMVILEGSSLREVSQFVARKLSTVEGVLGTATHFILKSYKDLGVCFESDEQDERLKVSP
jgi:DNA-binding Lrp family transcriptional regulator